MNRFQKQKRRRFPGRGPLFSLLLLFGILALFFTGVSSVSETTLARQAQSLRDAIMRCCVHCYAVEGAYPESLSYLEKHYGIFYDKAEFLVDYEVIGSNVLPDVTVFSLKNQEVYR